MAYGEPIQLARVTCSVAEGNFGLPMDRGRFIGGPIVWDKERREFRDYALQTPDLRGLTEEERNSCQMLNGVAYEENLKAAILNWRIAPRDIDEEFWCGSLQPIPGVFGRYTRERPLPGNPSGQMWRIIRPAGTPGTTFLQQYNALPGLTCELTSARPLEQDPCFCVSMFCEATPRADDATLGEAEPYVYMGFTFGGVWHVRLHKGWAAELYKRVGGQWKFLSYKQWGLDPLFSDSYGDREMFCTVMALDGALVLKSSVSEESWYYQDPVGPIRVAAAPLTLTGNAGPCYFGIHDIEFAQGAQNLLVARQPSDAYDNPNSDDWPAPVPYCVGSKPAGTLAEAVMIDPQTGQQVAAGTTPRRFYTGLRLESLDGKRTPVVRAAGIEVPPVTAEPAMNWTDVSADFLEATGGYTLDIEARAVTSEYTVKLKNRDGRYTAWRGNRAIAFAVGRPGSEAAGAGGSWDGAHSLPARRFTSLAEVLGAENAGPARRTVTLRTLDGLKWLEDVQIGWRRALDGLTVAQAMRLVLQWCNWPESKIGTIYDNPKAVLPMSGFAFLGTRDLTKLPDTIKGALDTDAQAACQLRADLSGRAALRWLCNFDYNTFVMVDEAGMFNYLRPGTTVTRAFTTTTNAVAENEIKRRLDFRPRLSEGHTSVSVSGRERSTGRPLASRAYDFPALTDGSLATFQGIDKCNLIHDDNLNELRLVQLRTRLEFLWLRRLRDMCSFEASGQRALPTWLVTVDGEQMYIMATHDEIRRGGVWKTTMDLVDAA